MNTLMVQRPRTLAFPFGSTELSSAPAGPRDSFLRWLRAGRVREFSPPTAVVVAHPDDEVIGLGGQLASIKNLLLVHVTDGSPKNLFDARRSGFTSREEYGRARQQELERALALAGHDRGSVMNLGRIDQEASLDMAGIARQLVELFRARQPAVVLTQAYEGGHPDHDATALAVHAALQLLGQRDHTELVEMTAYHNRSGSMGVGEFLPEPDLEVTTVHLSAGERSRKRQMLDCYTTQELTLRVFSTEAERFRAAPRYDFTEPPHRGKLYYELFDWGVRGVRWRELAQAALTELGITEAI